MKDGTSHHAAVAFHGVGAETHRARERCSHTFSVEALKAFRGSPGSRDVICSKSRVFLMVHKSSEQGCSWKASVRTRARFQHMEVEAFFSKNLWKVNDIRCMVLAVPDFRTTQKIQGTDL